MQQGRSERVQPSAGEKLQVKTAWDVEAGARCRKLLGNTSEAVSRGNSSNTRRLWAVPLSWNDSVTGEERVLWREIDRVSRLVFPALFLLFVLTYWPILLLKKT
jgi:hypothetical protein